MIPKAEWFHLPSQVKTKARRCPASSPSQNVCSGRSIRLGTQGVHHVMDGVPLDRERASNDLSFTIK